MVTLHIVYTLQACDQILYNKILTIKKYRIYILYTMTWPYMQFYVYLFFIIFCCYFVSNVNIFFPILTIL